WSTTVSHRASSLDARDTKLVGVLSKTPDGQVTSEPMPKLVAYTMDGHAVRIRPAPLERDWMDSSDQRFAYRCLPLNIANAHGWELLCPSGFSARWDGLNHKETIRIKPDLGTQAPAISHFGHGVLTFHMPC